MLAGSLLIQFTWWQTPPWMLNQTASLSASVNKETLNCLNIWSTCLVFLTKISSHFLLRPPLDNSRLFAIKIMAMHGHAIENLPMKTCLPLGPPRSQWLPKPHAWQHFESALLAPLSTLMINFCPTVTLAPLCVQPITCISLSAPLFNLLYGHTVSISPQFLPISCFYYSFRIFRVLKGVWTF